MAAKGIYSNEEKKEKWMSVLKPEAMSSDESGDDDGDEVILVHSLPWLSAEVTADKQNVGSLDILHQEQHSNMIISLFGLW